MTEAANLERQRDGRQSSTAAARNREDLRLVVKFGDKKRYSDQQCQAIYQELVEAGLDDEATRNPDAIEAVFKSTPATGLRQQGVISAADMSRKRYVNHPNGGETAAAGAG